MEANKDNNLGDKSDSDKINNSKSNNIPKIRHIMIVTIDENSIKSMSNNYAALMQFDNLLYNHFMGQSDIIYDVDGRGIIYRREIEIPNITNT